MKIASFAILLTLLLAPSLARADVFTFPLPDETSGYAQPYYYYPQNNGQAAQRVQPSTPPQPRAYNCPCPQPAAVRQPSAYQQPYAQPIAQPFVAQEDRAVYFGFGKSRLGKEAEAKLNTLAIRPVSTNSMTFTSIVGYADRIGSVPSNEKLSRKRAETVRDYLIKRGLIEPHNIQTRWYGKSHASHLCSMKLPRAKLLRCLQPDRRVEVNIEYRPQSLQPR